MKKQISINKVVFTAESIFDYTECMNFGKLPKADIKKEVEEYLKTLESEKSLLNCRYLRLKYFDELSNNMLFLFFYRGMSFGKMQMWKLSGICLEDEWSAEDEYDGLIRNWLKTQIEDLPNEVDWVVSFRVWQKEQQRLQEEYND